MRFFILVTVLLYTLNTGLHAQCASAINSFPYIQDFEASNGGWYAGGTASDWAHGTPLKPTISTAGSGQKCWIAGGLQATSYSNGENSWLMSPCFDFTNLASPYITFKVFWDTEKRWDGASMEYSTDGGNNWVKAGSVSDTTNCYTANWFNYPSINNVGEGWSGTVKPNNGSCLGGGGSGEWVEAKHQFLNLAGKPSVRFRFTFTAGTTCNTFDGFAFDDFAVMNTPPPTADFTYACSGNSTVAFISTSSCITAYQWNFGDPASGADNLSTIKNPVHTFSAPGSYTITLKVDNGTGQLVQSTQTVTVLGVTTTITSPVSCHNALDGAIMATASGGTGAYTFSWSTSPPRQTAAINRLAGGNYSVVVLNGNACPATALAILDNPVPLTHDVLITNESCARKNGAALINEAGGTAPYTYLWHTIAGSGPTASNLAAGSYSLEVKDAHGCADTIDFAVQNINSLQVKVDSIIPVSCFGGADGSAIISASGGIGGFTFSWAPAGGNASTAYDLKAGTYTVTVTDGPGCTGSKTVTIPQPRPYKISLGNDTVVCPGTKLLLSPGSFSTYRWQDNSTVAAYDVKHGGTYWVIVTNDKGCLASDTVKVVEECNDIVFPTAFTPNGDGKNDLFRPLGTLSAVSNFKLSVYNRWGQQVYYSTNPRQGWNGQLNGLLPPTETLVWTAEFSFNNQPVKLYKGTVILLR